MEADPKRLPDPANEFGSDSNFWPNWANKFGSDPNPLGAKANQFAGRPVLFSKKANRVAARANWLAFLDKQAGREGYALALSLLGVPWPAKRTFKSSKAAWAPGCLCFAKNLMLL